VGQVFSIPGRSGLNILTRVLTRAKIVRPVSLHHFLKTLMTTTLEQYKISVKISIFTVLRIEKISIWKFRKKVTAFIGPSGCSRIHFTAGVQPHV
jgi:hypothetical protein